MPQRNFTPAEVQLARNNLQKARDLISAAAEKLFDLGDVLASLRDRNLYTALGEYLSFRHFLRKEGLIPYSTAMRYMLLARQFPSPNSRKRGIDALVELLKLAKWEGKEADEIASDDEAMIDGRPLIDHTAESLRAANERRREELERRREELRSDPALAEQHEEARRTARRLEKMFERTIAGPDVEARAVRVDGQRGLRIRIDISLEDATELLALLDENKDD